MEVGPQTRKEILQNKLKFGWEMCNVAYYLIPQCVIIAVDITLNASNTKGKKPALTVSANKMKECATEASELKYIDCVTYNKYNKQEKINQNHSALSKDCPSLQGVLTSYRNNIEH